MALHEVPRLCALVLWSYPFELPGIRLAIKSSATRPGILHEVSFSSAALGCMRLRWTKKDPPPRNPPGHPERPILHERMFREGGIESLLQGSPQAWVVEIILEEPGLADSAVQRR